MGLNSPKKEKKVKKPAFKKPRLLQMEFFPEGMSKRDVIDSLKGRAATYGITGNAYYQIIKHQGGWATEMQDGKNYGYLQAVLEKLADVEELTFEILEGHIRVIQRKNKSGFSAYQIMEDELNNAYIDTIEPTKKLTKLFQSGNILLMTGSIILLSGVLSLGLAFIFKYLIVNKDQPAQLASDRPVSLTNIISGVKAKMVIPGIYLEKLEFKDGEWKFEEKSLAEDAETSIPSNIRSAPTNRPSRLMRP